MKLTTILILGIFSVCCVNLFSLVVVPLAFYGLSLLDNGDWENRHLENIRLLSEKIMNMEWHEPRYYVMDREEYFKEYCDGKSEEEKCKLWNQYCQERKESYQSELKKHREKKEELKRELDNLRGATMPENVLHNYVRAKKIANVALFLLILHVVILVIVAILDKDGVITKQFMDLF